MFIFTVGVSSTTMTSPATSPESVSISVSVPMERDPEAEYWPLTIEAVRDCDLSYFNDKWSEDMVRDGMRAILRAGELP